MVRRHLPAIAAATLVVVAFAGVQSSFGADDPGWSSSLKTGDVVARGTVWKVTVTPTPDEVDLWASGRIIDTDKAAPFETPLDLAPGDYKLGFCYRKDGVQKCATTEPGTGIVARVTVADPTPAPPPPPPPTTTTTTTTTTPSTPPPTSASWSSSLKTGDVVARGTVWKVTVTPTPDEVDLWASGRIIDTDKAAPFETPLDLAPGDYKLGFCYRKDGVQKCATTEPGTGIVARVTVADPTPAPPPPPPPTTTTTTTTTTPSTPPPTSASWSSSLKTGDVVARGTVWKVTVTPTPDEVDLWASGRIIDTDKAAPFETPLDLAPGDYKLGFCYRKDGVQKCATTEPGTGIVARVTVADPTPAPPPPPPPTTTTTTTTTTPSTPPPTSNDQSSPKPVRRINVDTAATSSVRVQWSSSRDNVGVSGYGLFLNGRTAGTTPETRYTFGSLACGTGYLVGVDAYDAAGNHSRPTSTTVSTSACIDITPPGVPSGIALAAATESTVVLTWQPPNDNVGVVGYGLYVGGLQVGSTSEAAATLSNLSCGRSYEIGIDAVDAAGNRSTRASAYFSTAACPDTQPPSKPTGMSTKGATATSVTVSWSPSIDNVGIAGYGEYRGSTRVATTTQTTATISGLACGTAYTLGVDAADAAGNRSAVATVSASTQACAPAADTTPDTTPPSVPGSLHPVSAGATSVNVAWSASTDNTGVAHYELYRGSSSTGTTTQTTAGFTSLACGTAYTLGVAAVDAAGNRSALATVSASTQACAPAGDSTAPSVPGSPHVVSAGATSVNVAWSASTDNTGVAGYGLYRGSSGAGTTTQTTASFSGLACGTAYTLGVDAVDAAGNRSARADITVTTSACPDAQAPTVPTNVVAGTRTGTSIALSWSSSTDNVGVVGYGLYRGGSLASTTSGTTGIVSGLTCGTNYTLGVDAYDAAGNRSAQAVVMVATAACADTQAPTAPTGLKASGVTQTGLTASWTASTDNVGVTGYDVYRNGTKIGSTGTLTYALSTLTCNTAYTVAVVAYDVAGNRSPQAQLVVSTSSCPVVTSTGSVSVSPSGNDATCSRGGTACKTWLKGYQLAQAGDTITVDGGTYNGESFTGTKQVTFRVAAGKTATMNGTFLADSLKNVTVYGPLVFPDYDGGVYAKGCASNLEFHDLSGKKFFIYESAQDIRFYGGDWGGYTSGSGDPGISGYNGSGSPSCGDGIVRNVLFDGVRFHDVLYQPSSQWGGAHPDCLETYGKVDGITVRDSVFERCGNTYIGFYTDFGNFTNVLIENNVFRGGVYESYWSTQIVQKSGFTCGVVFRYNTYDTSAGANAAPRIDCSSTQAYGNIFKLGPPSSECHGSWSYNVFESTASGGNCGSNALSITDARYVNRAAGDYHLSATSPAMGKGDPTRFPSTDFEGTSRSSSPDAGYDEVG